MKRMLLILLPLAGSAMAQQGNTVTIPFAGAPTGTCSTIMVASNLATGDYYNCLLGAWNKIATGGGNVISGTIATNQVPKGTAASVLGASSITDDGTKVSTTEQLAITGPVNTTGVSGTPALIVNSAPTSTATVVLLPVAGGTTGPSIRSDGSNLVVNALGANTLYLNLDTGTSVAVGNGAGGVSGFSVSSTGAATGTSVLSPTITGSTTNVAGTVQAGIDANTVGSTAALTVRGENVVAGGSNNLAGGPLVLAAGIGTGTSTPATVAIKSSALGLAAAATQNALVTRYVTHVKAGSTTSAQATTLFNIASANNTGWGLEVLIHVDLISSTPNVCSTTEHFSLSGTNNNGTPGTVNIVAGTISTLCSTGTLTLAVSATAANPSVISVTPTWGTITSITSATITVQIYNVSQQEIALL